MEKRSIILLNTKERCFFCLGQLVKQEQDEEAISEGWSGGSCLFSLHTLCNYLKISLNIGNDLKVFSKGREVASETEMEVEVSTCEPCRKVGVRFSELFLELERIQLEVDHCLASFHRKMSDEKEDNPLLLNFLQEMNDEESNAHFKIVDKLRKEIQSKSSSFRFRPQSGVQVDKVLEKDDKTKPGSIFLVKEEPEDFQGQSNTPEASPPLSPFNPMTLNSSSPRCSSDEPPSRRKKTFKRLILKPYKCNRCCKLFASKYYRNRHQRLCKKKSSASTTTEDEDRIDVTLPLAFKCDPCGTPFGKRVNLNRHRKNCTGIAQPARRSMSVIKTYRRKGSMAIYNPETGNYKCSACFKEFSRTGVFFHYDSVHRKSTFECDKCHAVYNRAYRLTVHKRTCNGVRPRMNLLKPEAHKRIGIDYVKSSTGFDCLHCGKSFSRNGNARMHVLLVHHKLFKCELCSKSFPTQSKLASHEETCGKVDQGQVPKRKKEKAMAVTEGETKKYKCKICAELFTSRFLCISHWDHVHSEMNLKCDICDKICKSKAALKYHKRQCVAQGEQRICEVCGKSYQNAQTLKAHVESSHLGKLYKCKFCNKEFSNRPCHWRHVKNKVCQKPEPSTVIQEGYKCDVCNLVNFEAKSEEYHKHREECLAKREELERRRGRTYKRDLGGGGVPVKVEQAPAEQASKKKRKPSSYVPPPAACHICGKWFSRQGGVNQHVKLIHFGERPFICDLCGKCFKGVTELNRHKASAHLGETFNCEVCQKEFKSWDSLRYHKKKCEAKPEGQDQYGTGRQTPDSMAQNYMNQNPGPSSSCHF